LTEPTHTRNGTTERRTCSLDDRTFDSHADRIDRYLSGHGLSERRPRVLPLTGDASDRRYFRVLLDDGASIVLALHAGPIEFNTLPFANVAELLQKMELPVPAILGHSDADGILGLQDLGDVTLQAHLGAASRSEHAALYREAVSLVEILQRRGRELTADRFIPYRIAFDVEKLTWELEFFVKHFLLAYRGVSLSDEERKALGVEWSAIAEELAAEPRVLCHRDYHSRNLMWHEGRLYLIDFQDARLGPDTYDLVSLLRDSYVDLTDLEVDELIAYFLALKKAAPGEAQEFRRRFDLMALQRNLKALGTFGYQTTTRGNTVYIQYMPRTLRYVMTNLEKHERFANLRRLLAVHLEEVR
jgi:N-acetylmuramate 1-kinase